MMRPATFGASPNVTCTELQSFTTWELVTMWPSDETKNPVPSELLSSGSQARTVELPVMAHAEQQQP